MTRNPLALIIAVLVLLGSFVAAVLFARFGDPEPPVRAMELRATQEPSATATPSPLPTVDYQAVYPAQTQAAAAYDLARAQERIARAAATLARATEQAYQAALMIGTTTAIERQTQQAEQTAQAQANREAAYIERERARILAEIDKNKNDEITRQNVKSAGLIIGEVVAGAIILAVVYVITYRAQVSTWQRATMAAMTEPLDNIAPDTDAPRFIPVGSGSSHTSRVPIDDDTFAVWAARMLVGETAGINKWDGADSPFYGKRAAYEPFLDEMERRGYVIFVPGRGKVLSDTGAGFCRGWLRRKGYDTPPPEDEVYATPKNAMIHTIPCHPGGATEGEGGHYNSNRHAAGFDDLSIKDE